MDSRRSDVVGAFYALIMIMWTSSAKLGSLQLQPIGVVGGAGSEEEEESQREHGVAR
jgi:hypothetical protein